MAGRESIRSGNRDSKAGEVHVTDSQLTHRPVMKTGMLIRRPIDEVFEAFVNPEITTRFWFTKSTGRLEPGILVHWHWEMYDVSAPVNVIAVEPPRRIVIEWPDRNGPTTVEWTFSPREDGSTFVSITNSGFTGTADELVQQVADSMQGFSFVLAGCKALLEHGIELNLVADHNPPGLEDHARLHADV